MARKTKSKRRSQKPTTKNKPVQLVLFETDTIPVEILKEIEEIHKKGEWFSYL